MTQQGSGEPSSDGPTEIRIFGIEDPPDRSLFRRQEEFRVGRGEVPVQVLRDRLTSFMHSMQDVMSQLPVMLGDFELNQMALSVEISAKGSISLLGSGGEIGGKSGLTFTFTRAVGSGEMLALEGVSPGHDDGLEG